MYKWVCLRNFVIELALRADCKPFARKKENNERTSEYLQDKERGFKEQTYFELLYVSCISFTS